MKGALFLVFLFVLLLFAVFPLTENNSTISVSDELPVSAVDGVAKTSMILVGLLFSLI